MPAPRIARTVGFQRKKERVPTAERDHITNIHNLFCVICGAAFPQAHHLRNLTGENNPGTSRRRADKYAIPLCNAHHNGSNDSAHHDGDDEVWLAGKGIDGRALAAALWAARGDIDAMQRVVFRFHQGRDL